MAYPPNARLKPRNIQIVQISEDNYNNNLTLNNPIISDTIPEQSPSITNKLTNIFKKLIKK